MKPICALCGKPTVPAAMIGNEAIGPKCAKRAGLLPGKLPRGTRVRIIKAKAGPRRGEPFTPDLFSTLEEQP